MFNAMLEKFTSANGSMLGANKKKKRKEDLNAGPGGPISVTMEDPDRAQEAQTAGQLNDSMSNRDQKRKRRQRPTKGANPFVRGATILG